MTSERIFATVWEADITGCLQGYSKYVSDGVMALTKHLALIASIYKMSSDCCRQCVLVYV